MPSVLAAVNLFAGLSFTPGIRGILVVAVGVAVLMGSTYLLLATNVGARLGLLMAFAGLFGWLTILTLIWWLSPPAIGPRGNNASWRPVEYYTNGPETPRTEEVGRLISPASLPDADRILAENPELGTEYPNGFVLSDLEANNPDILARYLDDQALDGWRLVGSSSAGESQAAADTALINDGVFATNADYKKLNTWDYGGKPRRVEECPDDGAFCRAQFRVERLFTFWDHPVHYAVVQVQPVITQEARPGEPPPLPKVDPTKPVISVVLVRDLGDVRLIPFLYFVISLSLFILFAWALHSRDKTLMENKALAEAAGKEA